MPKKILLVTVRPHEAEHLRRAGYDVDVVGSFSEAREALQRLSPDVLVTNARLGEFNGLSLAYLFLLNNPEGSAILTGDPLDPVLARETLQSGVRVAATPSELLVEVERVCAESPRPQFKNIMRRSDSPLSDPGSIFIAWDPDQVSVEDYAALVLALGDIARAGGAAGIKRIRSEMRGIPLHDRATA